MAPKDQSTASQESWRFPGVERVACTPIPEVYLDRIMARLFPSEHKVMMWIFRCTYGSARSHAAISVRAFCAATGLSRTGVHKALAALTSHHLIRVQPGDPSRGQPHTYHVDFDDPRAVAGFAQRFPLDPIDADDERLQSPLLDGDDRRQVARNNVRAWERGAAGRITVAQWQTLKQTYDYRCACCGEVSECLTIDHVIPLVAGGSNNISNVRPLCGICNSVKGSRLIGSGLDGNGAAPGG